MNAQRRQLALNYILFPFDVVKRFGGTRSGNLLIVKLSFTSTTKTHSRYFRRKEVLARYLLRTAVIAIGPKGTTLGNIEVFEYLKRVPVGDVRGFWRFEDLFNALGLDKFEINEELVGNSPGNLGRIQCVAPRSSTKAP
jgi:hypothetical protein